MRLTVQNTDLSSQFIDTNWCSKYTQYWNAYLINSSTFSFQYYNQDGQITFTNCNNIIKLSDNTLMVLSHNIMTPVSSENLSGPKQKAETTL